MPDEAVVETPAAVTPPVDTPAPPAEPIAKTLKEVEADYRRSVDLKLGRDPDRFKLKDTPKSPVAATPVATTPIAEPVIERPKGRAGRRAIYRVVEAQGQQIKQLLEQLNSPKPTTTPTPTPTAEIKVEEPKREAYRTVEEWVAAIREFDRSQTESDLKKAQEAQDRKAQEEAGNAVIEDFNKRLGEVKKKHDDWDDVADKLNSNIGFSGTVVGVLMSADLEVLYDLGKNPKEARVLGRMTDQSAVAVGNSDDVTSMLRYLAKHPDDIDTINELSAVKAAKFVGKLEARLETESKEAAKATPNPPNPSGPVAGAPTTLPVAETAPRQTPPKAKPEPPPALSGAPPASSDDDNDSANMTLAERERRWKLKHQKR